MSKSNHSLKHIGCIIGTRPEVIKMAPVIRMLQKQTGIKVSVIATAQHRELLDHMLDIFQITPDIDLNIMQAHQHLAGLTALLTEQLEKLIRSSHYDAWIVQGDTTTAMIASLIACYHHVPFAHVEAGLRSFDLQHPFPEELNRKLIGQMATWHFVPTETEQGYLLAEGISPEKITITGNTVIDALYEKINQLPKPMSLKFPGKRLLLVTAHRRENHGSPLENLCHAFVQLTEQFDDIEIVYPVHPNPNVQDIVNKLLKHQPRIHLLEPLDYENFIPYLMEAYLVLTDSGGIQEEAPALGKPVLILREKTERAAILTMGVGRLVGTDPNNIVRITSELLTDAKLYASMSHQRSPYGDGQAAKRIVDVLMRDLC